MFHNDPFGDHLGLSTNELISVLVRRIDAPNSLFSLLALMVEMSGELPVKRQYQMSSTLRDAANMIEQRSAVRAWVDVLRLPAYHNEGPS